MAHYGEFQRLDALIAEAMHYSVPEVTALPDVWARIEQRVHRLESEKIARMYDPPPHPVASHWELSSGVFPVRIAAFLDLAKFEV
ncbi:MAG: hypothetical protein JXA33_01305 [Anaerolineae bacterium]|nr:hypothetical protein [Anaerolineae bacterium]